MTLISIFHCVLPQIVCVGPIFFIATIDSGTFAIYNCVVLPCISRKDPHVSAESHSTSGKVGVRISKWIQYLE